MIRVNMACHLQLVHSEYVCFWSARSPVAPCGLPRSSTARTTSRTFTGSVKAAGPHFANASRHMAWSGSAAGVSLTYGDRRTRRSGWIWRLHVVLARSSGITTSLQGARSSPHCDVSSMPPVDQLQIVYNSLLVTSAQPHSCSLIATMRAAVEDCDDLSSEGSLMLLSPPHDMPDATLPVGTTSTLPPAEDAISPVMITRRITPANRSLRYLEAGTLGASEPHHVLSRPSVLVHCQFEPPVSRRPASAGPVISPLGRSHPFLAVDGSSSHPGRRQSGYLRRSPEPRRTPALRR